MTESNQVWVIDDDRSIRWVLEKALTKAGIHVTCFSNANGVMEALERDQPEAIITDVRMPGMDGFAPVGISASSLLSFSRMSGSTLIRLGFFILRSTSVENPISQLYVVGNGIKCFEAISASPGYSGWT